MALLVLYHSSSWRRRGEKPVSGGGAFWHGARGYRVRNRERRRRPWPEKIVSPMRSQMAAASSGGREPARTAAVQCRRVALKSKK